MSWARFARRLRRLGLLLWVMGAPTLLPALLSGPLPVELGDARCVPVSWFPFLRKSSSIPCLCFS